MYSAPSPPWMVSLRGRCLELMTCSCGAKAAIVTSGSPAMYVPGTASSRPCEGQVGSKAEEAGPGACCCDGVMCLLQAGCMLAWDGITLRLLLAPTAMQQAHLLKPSCLPNFDMHWDQG